MRVLVACLVGVPWWALVVLLALALPGLLVWAGWVEAWLERHPWRPWK